MAAKRKIEVFSAGCATCQETIDVIKRAACPSCEVIIHDMRDGEVAKRANALGIRSIPAVVIEGKLVLPPRFKLTVEAIPCSPSASSLVSRTSAATRYAITNGRD